MATASAAVASTAEDEAGQDANSNIESSWAVKFDRIYTRFTYTPPNCRHDPSKPPRFSLPLNILFAFASAFTVADLYYTHPILNILAKYFDVSYEESASVPALAQAGYAIGLFFLCSLGDLLRRRRLVLWLVWLTATLWIILCLTKSFATFRALTFVVSITTVTPQLMLPLVGDLAPPERRATALSLVVSGAILGMLIARLVSGIVTNFVPWTVVYWIAFGIQYLILILLYMFMPDYPATNPGSFNYLAILWSIITIAYRNPVIVQACLIGFFTAATFTSYWTTLTFLLAGPPYDYSPLIIGLFALVGIGSMCFGPTYSRYIIDRIAPLHSTILGLLVCLLGVIIGTYTGTFTVAGPIIQAFAVDLGLQSTQISNRTAIFSVDPKARNRINTIYMVSVFCGQLMGTAAGNNLYARSGWIGSGSGSVGFLGAALVIAILRGPWETGWVGWHGGWSWRKTALSPPAAEEDIVLSAELDGTPTVVPSVASESREKVSTTSEKGTDNRDVEKGP